MRRLNFECLYSHRPAPRARLTGNQKRKRFEWAQEHERWTRAQWNEVLFSDEATFEVDAADHKTRCYRRKGERFLPQMILEKTNRGYGSVNVWAGIIGHHKTSLIRPQGRITAETYIRDILQEHVVPFFLDNSNTIFMQDNAPPHRARLTKYLFT